MEIEIPTIWWRLPDKGDFPGGGAAVCHPVHPSASTFLKLEAEVGTPLFLRDQGRLTLTDAGRICVAAAEDILRIERTAEASVAALQNRGQIDLGVTSVWGMALVADLLPEFRRAYPYVTLRITENRSYRQIKAALRAGRVDLAVMAVTPDDDVPAQGYVHLRQEEIVLVLPADHSFCREQAGDTVPRSVLSGALRRSPSCSPAGIRLSGGWRRSCSLN